MESIQKDQLLINGFLNSVNQAPGSYALDINEKLYSYKELFSLSCKIARNIIECSSIDNNYTAILASKSLVAYTGILGTLISGKGYVPLNKKFPVARTINMLEQSNAEVIVVGKECLDYFKELLPEIKEPLSVIFPDTKESGNLKQLYPQHLFCYFSNLDSENKSEIKVNIKNQRFAYLLFTSGSTGFPKGVPVSNENVCAYIDSTVNNFDFKPSDKFLQTFDLTFDLSVHDLFVCWKVGACLTVPADDASPVLLSSMVKEKQISVWFSVPSLALLLMKTRLLKKDSFPSLKYSLFCGEALSEKVAMEWQSAAPNSALINLYGPTETTVAIAFYNWKKETGKNNCINGIVPLGKVFETQEYCIVDENDVQVVQGEVGELLLSGTQVTKGYLKDEKGTNRQYVKLDKSEGKVWYKTGDLVKEDKDCNLHFIGRVDSQVKIKGYRIELQEIDQVIRKATHLEWVATVVENPGDRLVAFVCQQKENKNIEEAFILNYCRCYLPVHMIPDRICFIENMPLNSNGKIDRRRLLEEIYE